MFFVHPLARMSSNCLNFDDWGHDLGGCCPQTGNLELDHYLIHLISGRWEWDDTSRSFGWKWCDRKSSSRRAGVERLSLRSFTVFRRQRNETVLYLTLSLLKAKGIFHHLQHVLWGSPIVFLPKQEYSQFSHNLHHALVENQFHQSITNVFAKAKESGHCCEDRGRDGYVP